MCFCFHHLALCLISVYLYLVKCMLSSINWVFFICDDDAGVNILVHLLLYHTLDFIF
jgi:hypothetical protein